MQDKIRITAERHAVVGITLVGMDMYAKGRVRAVKDRQSIDFHKA